MGHTLPHRLRAPPRLLPAPSPYFATTLPASMPVASAVVCWPTFGPFADFPTANTIVPRLSPFVSPRPILHTVHSRKPAASFDLLVDRLPKFERVSDALEDVSRSAGSRDDDGAKVIESSGQRLLD